MLPILLLAPGFTKAKRKQISNAATTGNGRYQQLPFGRMFVAHLGNSATLRRSHTADPAKALRESGKMAKLDHRKPTKRPMSGKGS